jgi:hypothetical protein
MNEKYFYGLNDFSGQSRIFFQLGKVDGIGSLLLSNFFFVCFIDIAVSLVFNLFYLNLGVV